MAKPMLAYNPYMQFFNLDGTVLNGGKIYIYQPGTTTLLNTYPTSADALAGTNANPNPLICDSYGRPASSGTPYEVYVTQSYKALIKTSADVTIRTIDNIVTLGQLIATLSKTTNYTVTVSDRDKVVKVDASAGNITITLPAVATAGDGFRVQILKSDSSTNTVTIQANAAETINGSNTYILYNQYESINITSDGTLWTSDSNSNVSRAGMSQFLGPDSAFKIVTGTWTLTRNAQANYSYAHSAADETSTIAIDITNAINTNTGKGFKLTSFDVCYSIGTGALDAHSVTLDKVNMTNNAAVTVTSQTLSGSLATATQAQPYVTTITLSSPAYNNTACSRYVIELTVNNSASSVYNFYGINLKFTRNDI